MQTGYTSALRRRIYQWLLREPKAPARASRASRPSPKVVPPALADTLTGLPGRALLEDRVQQAVQHCRRRGACCAVLYVDLNRFVGVNDALGLTAGDTVLRTIAERLRSALRLEDTVARAGGDEFAIVLKEVAWPEDAVRLAHKVIEIVSRPILLGGHELRMGSRVGIAIFPDRVSDEAYLLENAEAAAGRAKHSRRSRVAL